MHEFLTLTLTRIQINEMKNMMRESSCVLVQKQNSKDQFSCCDFENMYMLFYNVFDQQLKQFLMKFL